MEARTFAVQKHGGFRVAFAVDRGYQGHGVDMSHNILCSKDRLDVLILSGKAAAQMGSRFGEGQVVGGNARLRYEDICVRWAILNKVFNTLFQALGTDDVRVEALSFQSTFISMRRR